MAWRTAVAIGLALVIAAVAGFVVARPASGQNPESWPVAVNDLPAEDQDWPIYDLPSNVSQQIVLDQYNREYLLLTTEQGGVCLIPFLDENGEQAVMPRA